VLSPLQRSSIDRPQAARTEPGPAAARPGSSSGGVPSDDLDDPREDRVDDAGAALRRVARLADSIARRTQLRLLQQKAVDDARQAELDRLQQEFDFDQKRRAELLREFNVMRDLALEQMKKDDEALKKWIALI
jgi:hypothetical protein